jgi:hypothetical protein
MRRAHGHPGLGQVPAARLVHRLRQAEVGHQRVTAAQENVLRLHVAVHNAVLVGVRERVRDLARDPEGFLERELGLANEPVAQALALDVGHGIPQEPCGLARVVQRQDVRVLEPRCRLDLKQEALDPK